MRPSCRVETPKKVRLCADHRSSQEHVLRYSIADPNPISDLCSTAFLLATAVPRRIAYPRHCGVPFLNVFRHAIDFRNDP
jgi:hypothetical protein